MSSDNWSQFKDVKMYRDDTVDPGDENLASAETENMESLFYLPTDSSVDPPQTSLFNITTLKQLILLGQSTVNIISNKDQAFNAEELDPAWGTLAK